LPPQPSAELEALKAAFEGHRVPRFFSGERSFRVTVGLLGLAMAAIMVAFLVLSR
jgi:hypothetical protein